jgi:cell division protein FtsZ
MLKKSRHRISPLHKARKHPVKRIPVRSGHSEVVHQTPEDAGELHLSFPKMKIVGIGGAGGNALTRISAVVHGIETVALNTDAQDLRYTHAARRVQMGRKLTNGRGAGMNPEVGRQAAEESRDVITQALQGAELVFLTCGLGGGTGSGAAPAVAEMCRSLGMVTIAVVTLPFSFEGRERMRIAQAAWNGLLPNVDALITVNNDRVFTIIDANTSLKKAFWHLDEILREGIQAIADLVLKPGLINVDFADLKTTVQRSGPALLGIGVAEGDDRAVKAAERAITNPLVDATIDDAHRVLFNISAASDLTMVEVQQTAKAITERVSADAKIIFGANFDTTLGKGKVKVTVIASGFEKGKMAGGDTAYPLPFSSGADAAPGARPESRTEEQRDASASSMRDALKEKMKPFESLEDQPAFLRKRRPNSL